MKKLMLPLFAVLFFAACKNSTPAPAADTQNLPGELKIEPAQVKEASAKATVVLQNMNKLMEDINTAAPSLNESQKVELEAIRSQLNDVMGKQEMMQKGLQAAENAGTTDGSALNNAVPPPGVLQDYIQSTSNYDQFMEDLRAQLEAVKSGTTKKN